MLKNPVRRRWVVMLHGMQGGVAWPAMATWRKATAERRADHLRYGGHDHNEADMLFVSVERLP